MERKMQLLRKPEGFKDLLPREAALKRRCETMLSRLFASWGYREVVPSTVEYSSIFTAGMKTDFDEILYRFSDERGRTLVLRPDLTLPLARIVATHMKEEPLPLRVFYQGSIFRHLPAKAGRQREFYQMGVELQGVGGPMADAELLALTVASLRALGIEEAKICLGNLGFVNSYLDRTGLKPEEKDRVKRLLSQKDLVALEEYAAGLGISGETREDILGLSRLKGGREVLQEGSGFFGQEYVREMQELFDLLDCLEVTDHVQVDLGLVRGLDYYTGIVFDGYTSGLGSPICGGGRYDQLLGCFGRELPAVGFAFNLDNILLLLSRQGLETEEAGGGLVAFSPGQEGRACVFATRLRQEGMPVETALTPADLEESRRDAQARRARRLYYLHGQDGVREEEL